MNIVALVTNNVAANKIWETKMANPSELAQGADIPLSAPYKVAKADKGILAAIWAGPVGFVLFGLATGPLLSGFLVPPSPTLAPTAITAMYNANANGIRGGAVVMMCAGCLFLAFFAAISGQLRRIEKTASPYAYTQLAAGTCAAFLFIIGSVLWCVAAYRPDRPPELTQLISDLACTFLVMPAPIGLIQNLPIAMAIYGDRNPVPLFPRWIAHMNIIVAILFIPGVFVVFNTGGQFAWNGFTAYWVPALAFAVWIVAMTWALLKAAKRVL